MKVITDISRVSGKLVDSFKNIPTASISDILGESQAMGSEIKPISKNMKLCGSAVTVKASPSDNLSIHKAIYICLPGDVLTIDVKEYIEAGYWGEIMTLAAQLRGISGIIINGGVRDTKEIEDINFPVFCQNVSIKKTTKNNLGLINHEIILAGVIITPGDIVVGDRDGVVVIPKNKAKNTLESVHKKIKDEKIFKNDLKNGKTTLDIFSLR